MAQNQDYYNTSYLGDPKDILLNYTSAYGATETSFLDLDNYMKTIVIMGIVFGVRIGLSAVALPTVYLVTKNKKSPIFILNMLCLSVLFIHSVLYACTLTETYNTLEYNFSLFDIYSQYASNLTCATNVLYVVLIALVEISLVYQVYIIFESPQARLKYLCYAATFIASFLGMATTAFYFTYMVYANKVLFDSELSIPKYIGNIPLILFVTSTCVICSMLLFKLGLAIKTRRFLGLKQFNLFHVLFIMSFQTMVIPTVIVLISFNSFSADDQYSSQAFSALGTALITISLPITTMWANSSVNNSTPTSNANTWLDSVSSSNSDNETFINSPTDTDFKKSSDDFYELNEKNFDTFDHLGKISNSCSNSFEEDLTPSTLKNDNEFWKEVELYTRDLDKKLGTGKNLSNNSNSDEGDDDDNYIKTVVETIIDKNN